MRTRALPLALTLTAAAVLVTARARAGDPAAAQALFDDAKQRTAAGNYAEACPRFEQSQAADPALGTQFHLADCWQKLGRTASAWSLFRDVASQAAARGETTRERVAKERAASLEHFVPKLTIDTSANAPTAGLVVKRDGAPVPREAWSVPLPVDPGSHTIAVEAPGKLPWTLTRDVAAAGQTVTVVVPALLDAPGAPGAAGAGVAGGSVAAAGVAGGSVAAAGVAGGSVAAAGVAGGSVAAAGVAGGSVAATRVAAGTVASADATAGAGATAPNEGRSHTGVAAGMPDTPGELPEAPVPIVDHRGGAQRVAGWVLTGAGVAGLAVGGYFGAKWLGDRHDVDVDCQGNVCNATGLQAKDDRTTHGRDAAIVGGAGVASLVVGIVLLATAPAPVVEPTPASARLVVTPVLDPNRAGLGLRGTW